MRGRRRSLSKMALKGTRPIESCCVEKGNDHRKGLGK